MSARILFITGTDTGVGKTLLTALLLRHLRRKGRRALAMKPFCSGGRADVELLHAVQEGELSRDEINPFYFEEPVAPLVSARQHQLSVKLPAVLRRIARAAKRCDWLLVEGSGGLLVPLGEGYAVADLIARLGCEVIVVSRNRLGTINHTLLTVRVLQSIGIRLFKVVLMAGAEVDESSRSNATLLAELIGDATVHPLKFLGRNPMQLTAITQGEKKVQKTLARMLG